MGQKGFRKDGAGDSDPVFFSWIVRKRGLGALRTRSAGLLTQVLTAALMALKPDVVRV